MICLCKYIVLVIVVAAKLAETTGSGSGQFVEKGRRDDVKARGSRERPSAARNGPQFYNRWEKDEANSIADNEISGLGDMSSTNNILRQDYACGRAIANKKFKDQVLGGDNQVNNQIPVSRNKYRPTEIRMPRIIGGDETSPGEFPWTVSMKLNGQPICGGSLIDRDWILTAAHCVVGYNPKNITVRLGAYRIKDSSEKQTIDLPVSMFIVHKEYSMPRPFSNDIALLKLNEPVDFSDFIIPICLPKDDHLNHIIASSATLEPPSGDYLKRFQTNGGNEDSGGIVVSTKMSDNDIAKCFNRLEQNYLNSIGLGHVNDPASAERTQTPPSATTTTTLSTPAPPTNLFFSYGNLINLMGSSGHNRPPGTSNNKITFFNHPKLHALADHFESPAHVMDHHNPIGVDYNEPPANHIYYGLAWNSNNRRDEAARKEVVKLSKLPINKELLREIQSVGSGSMQTLGLQQGDFMAMANDLAAGSGSSTGSGSSSDRERIIGNNRNHLRVSTEEEADDPSKYSGMSGIVVGWGWVREQDGEDQLNKAYPSVTLQKVKLPILRNNVCEAWFQSQAKKITLLPSQFCAGYNSGGKDACRGDSGGPMIIEDDSETGRYQLIGIVSAGIGCARPSLPGLYTRVASFLPWIRAQLSRY